MVFVRNIVNISFKYTLNTMHLFFLYKNNVNRLIVFF